MTASSFSLSRRRLLAGAAGCVGVLATEPALPADAAAEAITSESLAARLHASLSPEQRRQVCFA
ncbi:MAG: hypothetical protein DWI03_00605, partial [Planctomycetota bacterium]